MIGAATGRPRRVFSVLDHACRDLGVADDVIAGRFPIAGRTRALGLPPDWSCDPDPDDKEWRIEWVKFYYGLDLAHACATTGDRRYREAWERLVLSFATAAADGLACDGSEVRARRIQNWIYAWNRFEAGGNAPFAQAADADAVVDALWRDAVHVREHLSAERNHRTLELYALLVAAAAFPDRDPDGRSFSFALGNLQDNLLEDVRPDGVHREASTHYHCVALRSWLGAMALAHDAGRHVSSRYRDRLAAACDFAVHVHRPDGRIPACSDADGQSYQDVLLHAASLFGRADWLWAATGGREGRPPSATGVSFSHGGYHVRRSGWGADGESFRDARYLLFDCGPLGDGGHGHYDALHVECFGHGRPLLVDPGRYTYSEAGENWRRWFKGTAAHNTVLVDGLDQTPYTRRRPKGPTASCALAADASAPGLAMLAGEVVSPAYDAVHTRTVIAVADEYWLVVDHLTDRRPHRYELRWHLAPEAAAEDGTLHAEPGLVRTAFMTLAFAPALCPRVEAGWYAPRYGVKVPAPVVALAVEAYTTSFVTVIDPRPPGGRAPARVGFVQRGNRASDRSLVEVRGVGPDGTCSDLVTWSTDQGFFDLPPFRGRARAAWTRRDAGGAPLAFVAAAVREGSWRGAHGREAVADGGDRTFVTWTAGQPWSVGRLA